MKMLFVSVWKAGLDGPQVELAARTFGTDRQRNDKNQWPGLSPLTRKAARDQKGVSDLSRPVMTTSWLSEK